MIIPIMVYAGYLSFKNYSVNQITESEVIMQSFTAKLGQLSHFALSDGTQVWLNSGSTIRFPDKFVGDKRKVELEGEAYFDVVKNSGQPFLVKTNDLNIEVLGTSFNVSNYHNDSILEVVLVEGKVKLFSEYNNKEQTYGYLVPGRKAVYNKKERKVLAGKVDVDKYISWRDGVLIFRGDPMNQVVKRLSRWFNVDITIADPEIENYVYTATFSNETLSQVLYLLKVSAPINYKNVAPKVLANGELSKQKIILTKKEDKNTGDDKAISSPVQLVFFFAKEYGEILVIT
ncbi:MAG: DUF4974 domain-containing protein [Chloroflexia bacterium]|nr:DUF4974 domain-containing protein [Chloroflexia bacterium]